MGSAALYQCARLGARVIGVDCLVPPHDQGSSGRGTRASLVRPSAKAAISFLWSFAPIQIWEALEACSPACTLLVRNGCLARALAGMPGSHHGATQDTIAAAREFGIAHEVLSATEV